MIPAWLILKNLKTRDRSVFGRSRADYRRTTISSLDLSLSGWMVADFGRISFGELIPACGNPRCDVLAVHHKPCLGWIPAGVIVPVSIRMIPWIPAAFDVGPTP